MCMFLDFFQSACWKQFRQSKVGQKFTYLRTMSTIFYTQKYCSMDAPIVTHGCSCATWNVPKLLDGCAPDFFIIATNHPSGIQRKSTNACMFVILYLSKTRGVLRAGDTKYSKKDKWSVLFTFVHTYTTVDHSTISMCCSKN